MKYFKQFSCGQRYQIFEVKKAGWKQARILHLAVIAFFHWTKLIGGCKGGRQQLPATQSTCLDL